MFMHFAQICHLNFIPHFLYVFFMYINVYTSMVISEFFVWLNPKVIVTIFPEYRIFEKIKSKC